MPRRLKEAPDLRNKKEEITLPKEAELSVKNFSALISELLSAKKELDKFYSELKGAYDTRSKLQGIQTQVEGLVLKLDVLTDRVEERPDIVDDLLNLQGDISKLQAETDKIPALGTVLENLEAKLNALFVRDKEIAEIIPQVHKKGTDTSLGKQEKDLDMGGHKIVNVEGSEAANKEYVDQSIGRVSGRGGGGGIPKSGTPDENEYARWTKRSQLEGRSATEVKQDLDLEDADITALAEAVKLDDHAAPDDNTDLNASSTKHGLLPKLANTGSKYLRDDGTWQTIAGGGDMLKSTYDSNEDGVIALAQLDTGVMSEAEHAADGHTMTIDGRDVSVDGTKLDGIEANATADQTGAEIKTAYEAEADTNAYTDAEKTKLAGIEAAADVTDATNVDAAGAVMEGDTAGGDLGGTYPNPTVDAASDTVAGKVELATAAETTTGTDTGRAVTPDGLAGSGYGKRPMLIKLIDDATALAIGDGKFIFVVPAIINGWNLVAVEAHVTTVSSSGTPTYSIYNLTDSQDMLSTSITIDVNEYTSEQAATPPVINTSYDDVATGDRIEINKDVAGTGEKGDEVLLVFQLP